MKKVNKLFEAAWELHQFFNEHGYGYAIIGGFALQYWGEPRFTQDIDITVLPSSDDEKAIIKLLTDKFNSRLSDPIEFATKNRIVLIKTSNGIPADISLGIYGYEDGVIKRAVDIEFETGKKLKLCSAEDLIIHKAVAGRPRDIEDIESIILRQQEKLDVKLIRKWLKEFVELIHEIPVEENFERVWKKSKS